MTTRTHWVALATTGSVGGKTITRLLRHFGSLEAVFAASPGELQQVKGVGTQIAQAIAGVDLAAVEVEMADYQTQGIDVITWEDAIYPRNLLLTDHAPPVLFVRGTLPGHLSQAVAIVGTRQPTPNSRDVALRLAAGLAARGWVIVSGLALGIDTVAHRGALEIGGKTVAVLGRGVGQIYPRRNAALGEAIMGQGAIIAEVPPAAPISRQHLIARNRITSGLSRAVIVVQSSKDSGSASTARAAFKQGRAVFSVLPAGEEADHLTVEGAVGLSAADVDIDQLADRLAASEVARQSPDDDMQPRLF